MTLKHFIKRYFALVGRVVAFRLLTIAMFWEWSEATCKRMTPIAVKLDKDLDKLTDDFHAWKELKDINKLTYQQVSTQYRNLLTEIATTPDKIEREKLVKKAFQISEILKKF